jgi:glucose-6-phosphate isomerase
VGLPIALASGTQAFNDMLTGAHHMDRHFAEAPLEQNLPVITALTGIWNSNFLGASNHAVLAYDERLALLPLYLQQLETESNGKSVRLDGQTVDVQTMPILWGGVGTTGQHAYHQLLHQGTRAFSADFIVAATADHPLADHHRWLQANALAQSQAMMIGDDQPQAEKRVPGNHPTTTFVLQRLDAYHLGALLALYEHKVFCQGVIWGINSFDQWGVELGKRLAGPIYQQLGGTAALNQDASTQHLIARLRAAQSNG